MDVDVLRIDWSAKLSSSDFFDLEKSPLPFRDTGPLIHLPLPYAGATEHAFRRRPRVMRFDSVPELETHIYMHEQPTDYDFWCGICQPLSEQELPWAAAVMDQLVTLLDQANEAMHPPLLSIFKPETECRGEGLGSLITLPKDPELRVRVTHSGAGFSSIRTLHEWLPEKMLLVKNCNAS